MQTKSHVSISKQRQLEVLSRVYDVDKKNKIVRINLHYDKASEIIIKDISTFDRPLLKTDIIYRIESIIETLPSDYKIDLDIQIDDYEGYDPKKLNQTFKDLMELHHYKANRERSNSWLKAILFLLIGVSILIILNLINHFKWFPDDLQGNIVKYILDAFACVLIWQSVTVVALNPMQVVIRNNIILNSFHGISFSDKDHNVLAKLTEKSLTEEWVRETKKTHFAKTGELTAAIIFSVVAIIDIIDTICWIALKWSSLQINGVVISLVITYFSINIFQLLCAISIYETFLDRGHIRNLSLIFCVGVFFSYVANLIILSLFGSYESCTPADIFVDVIGIAACVLFFISFFLIRNETNKSNK